MSEVISAVGAAVFITLVGMGSTDHWTLAMIDGGRFHGLISDLPTACLSAE